MKYTLPEVIWTPSIDQSLISEYLEKTSDFKKAATVIDNIFERLPSDSFKVTLGGCTMETTLRQLHSRVMELNSAVKRAKGNNKKLVGEIDRLHINLGSLKNSLMEFLLALRNRIHQLNGVYERNCAEYGLSISSNDKGKSNLRWDHMRPDAQAVLGSLEYIENLSKEFEQSKQKYHNDLQTISSDLKTLGVKTTSLDTLSEPDFQVMLSSIDHILSLVDINGLIDMSCYISNFFSTATRIAGILPGSSVTLELEAKFAELELTKSKLKFEKKGKYINVPLDQITKLAVDAYGEATNLVTNASRIDSGIASLSGVVKILKRVQLCLPSMRAFMIELSKEKNLRETDKSELYYRLASRIPADLENIPTYSSTTGIFKALARELEDF